MVGPHFHDDLEQLEAPKVLWGSRSLRVGDCLRGLHIQEQGRYSRERNHLTTCLDLHKDHLGPVGQLPTSAWEASLRSK